MLTSIPVRSLKGVRLAAMAEVGGVFSEMKLRVIPLNCFHLSPSGPPAAEEAPPPQPAAPRSAVPASPAPVTLKNCRRVSPLEGPRPLKRPPLPSATAILLFGPCRNTND